MARVEPMDIDTIETDCDDKENSLHNSNVFPRPCCTEKGYEELDVSELNMKLRYSVTPASSPMSKSYTPNCSFNKSDFCDSLNNTIVNCENNLTRSLNSTIINTDSAVKSPKLPLQTLSTCQFVNGDKSSLVRRSFDIEGKVTALTIGNEKEDNISLPSTSSSTVQTPEATTPTKDITKNEVSPIMRGLKSVLNMFRPSQSPILPSEDMPSTKDLSSEKLQASKDQLNPDFTSASTPIANSKKDNSSKRNSPLKESVIFNNDLERELQWKDETTIFFKDEKIPANKLFSMQLNALSEDKKLPIKIDQIDKLYSASENMDFSDINATCTESVIKENKLTADFDTKVESAEANGVESDNEFVDCETTYTKKESYLPDISKECVESLPVIMNINDLPHEVHVENYSNPLNLTNILECPEECHKTSLVVTTNNLSNELFVQDNGKEFEMTHQLNPDEKHPNNDLNVTCMVESVELDEPLNINKQPNVNKDILFRNASNKHLDITNFGNLINYIHDHESLESNEASFPVTIKEVQKSDQKSSVSNNISYTPESLTLTHFSIHKLTDTITEDNVDTELLSENHNILTNLPSTEVKMPLNSVNHDYKDNEITGYSDLNVTNTLDIIRQDDANKEQNHGVMLKGVNCDNINKTPFASIGNKWEMEVANLLPNDEILEFTDCKSEISYTSKDITGELYRTNSVKLNNSSTLRSEDTYQSNLKESVEKTLNIDSESSNANIIHQSIDDLAQKSLNKETVYDETFTFDVYNENNVDSKLCLETAHCLAPNDTLTLDSQEHFPYDKMDLNNLEGKTSSLVPNREYPMNNTHIHYEGQNEPHNAVQNELHNHLPFDIPLPNYDDIDKDNSADPSSIKNTDDVIFTNELGSGNEKTFKQCESLIEYDKNLLQAKKNSHINIVEKNTIQEESQNKTESNFMNSLSNAKTDQDIISLKIHKLPYKNDDTDVVNHLLNKIEEANVNIDNEFIMSISNEEHYKEYCSKAKMNDEVILTSTDNCHFDSMTNMNAPSTSEKNCNSFGERDRILSSPPISPESPRKGYNINLDEIDDPFATKTKIRMSPTPETRSVASQDSENKNVQNINSNDVLLKEQKACDISAKMNNSIATQLNEKVNTTLKVKPDGNHIIKNTLNARGDVNPSLSSDVDNRIGLLSVQSGTNYSNDLLICKTSLNSKDIPKQLIDSDDKNTALSLSTDNSCSTETKSVYNLPEIQDNFKNIVSKLETCPSITSQEQSVHNLTYADEMHHTEPMCFTICNEENIPEIEKVTTNIGNTTCSSTNTDEKNVTVHEIHTEDEDTIEGPFLDLEEFSQLVKVSDFEKEKDVMEFDDLSPFTVKENTENELFIDAETYEFLLNQNKSNVVIDSGKESLFLKFDPLFAKRVSSDCDLDAINAIRKQSTPKKIVKKVSHEDEMIAGPSNIKNIPVEFHDEVGNFVSKPMMVVNPAVKPTVSSRKSITPRVNRQSLTIGSPAMVVIDRLLSLSANSSLLDNNTTLSETNENNSTDIAIIQLRELLAEKEIQVHNLRCESKILEERLNTLESQVSSLESKSRERLRKISDLNEHLAKKTEINKSLASALEEYERTIVILTADLELDKKRNAEEKMRLIRDRDEQTNHLARMEDSYNDLHSKYEKSKQIIFSMKANEDIYKKSLKEFENNFNKIQNNYELLKQHATTKLNHANQELGKINRAHEAEVVKLTTMLKRKELETTSLEETLAQKIKANKELTAICDELISKVG